MNDLLKAHPSDGNTESKIYKFVRVDGQYLFADPWTNHDQIAKKGETAGTILVDNKFWRVMSNGSMTLGIGMDANDEANLTELLKRPRK